MTIRNSRILIFGGAGSLGTSLIRKFINQNNTIFSVSRDEAKQWHLRRNVFCDNPNLKVGICDIRDKNKVHSTLKEVEPDVVILAAAMKQVDTCEFFPEESIKTNILGIQNVLEALNDYCPFIHSSYRITFCFVSTDKAVCPINTYGMCKSISEKLVLKNAMNNSSIFHVVTRYGNVLDSKGSIIPLLHSQGQNPLVDKFTLTDPKMTRFMMTLDESVDLIETALDSARINCGILNGSTWIPTLDSMNLGDLFRYFSEKYNKGITISGIRPGEKIHELLMNEEECRNSRIYVDESHKYFVIPPNGFPHLAVDFDKAEFGKEYSSGNHIVEYSVLEQRLNEFLNSGTYKRDPK